MEYDSSEEITPISVPIKAPENRGLAAVVADLVLEAKQHTVGLQTLYNELCEAEHVVPKTWGIKLVEAYERHAERTQRQILSLRTVIA
jgi:hypothetical protein